MNLLGNIQPTHDALTMQQLRLQVIAENIAQAQTTKTESGGPYKRRELVFSSYMDPAEQNGSRANLPRLKLDSIKTDETPGQRVHQPGHPHADKDGYVTYPNVAVSLEMVDLMQAARAYEANLQVVKTSKQMVEQALSISK